MSKFKKLIVPISAIACTLAMVSSVPFASAGAGEWDYVGEESFGRFSENYNSGGGDFKVVRGDGGSCERIELWEYDPESTNDFVGRATLCPKGVGKYEHVFDVRGFTDGTNGQAELHVKKLDNTGSLSHYIFFD